MNVDGHGGEAHRFQPGESGNPAGRPRKGETYRELLEEESVRLVKDVLAPEGHREKINAKRMIARKLVLMALGGNLASIESVMNRVDGHPAETLNVGGGGEFRVRIVPITEADLKAMEGVEVVQPDEGAVLPSYGAPTAEAEGPGSGSTGT